jgi:hypothetical protein
VPQVGGQARKSCAWPLMVPRAQNLGVPWKVETKTFALASHGAPEQVAWRIHERSIAKKCVWLIFNTFKIGWAQIFLCLASNFWHQMLTAYCKNIHLDHKWSLWTPSSEVPKHVEHKKKLLQPFYELPSFELKSSHTCRTQVFCIQPPTFDAESWRLSAKQIASTSLETLKLGA